MSDTSVDLSATSSVESSLKHVSGDATLALPASQAEHMLTTIDNPFDPWHEFMSWFAWDVQAGYHTPSLLARIVHTSDDLSDADQSLALEYAIDEIIRENPNGLYKKVTDPKLSSS